MDRFIVGTGRCGSTLLSRMLAQHPDLLSLFELFNGIDVTRRFAPEPLEGRSFGALIAAEQPFVSAVLRRGYEVAEIRYPFATGSRFRRDDPLPWILVSMLPRLSQRPDALFDELMEWVAGQPRQPAVAHYRALFEWLIRRCGRALWVERSGSSLHYLGALCAAFPEARFLHLHRDGPEAALSMLRHHAYRLPISMLYAAPLDDGTPFAALGELDLHAPPRAGDPVSRLLASRPPAPLFGRYWSDQVCAGWQAWRELPPERYAELRFEDLLERPREALTRIADFFELPPAEGWIERAVALLAGAPATRVPDLPRSERVALEEACRPGMEWLGRA